MKYMYYRNALTSESLHPDKKKKKIVFSKTRTELLLGCMLKRVN